MTVGSTLVVSPAWSAAPEDEIKDLEPVMTMVGGRIVYTAQE